MGFYLRTRPNTRGLWILCAQPADKGRASENSEVSWAVSVGLGLKAVCHFCPYSTIQSLATWPHLPMREAGNIQSNHMSRRKRKRKREGGLVNTEQSLPPFSSPITPTPVFSCLQPTVIQPTIQGLTNNGLRAKSSPWPISYIKLSLRLSHAHLFTYCLCCFHTIMEQLNCFDRARVACKA